MIDLDCPLCGKPVRVPQAKPLQRLLCKKCHTPFHLNKSGSIVIGDPPSIDAELEEVKQKLREKAEKVPVKWIVPGLVTLFVLGIALYFLFQPAESLEGVAERAAEAFAENDPDYLKSIAAPGTADDVARWYDTVHPLLEKERARWSGREEVTEVHVAQEDPAKRRGATVISIHPRPGSGLADPTVATASAAAPVDVATVWTLNRWGRWKLDGSETYGSQPKP